MDLEIISRTLWAFIFVLLGVGGFRLTNRILLTRVRAVQDGLESRRLGIPAILYFTTPGCQPCRTIQRPALAQLQAEMGERLQVIEIDCAERPDLAEKWGILSVPTTFIIDRLGRARGVNHGVVRTEALREQVSRIE